MPTKVWLLEGRGRLAAREAEIKAYRKEYYSTHKAESLANQRKLYALDVGKSRASRKAYREKNKPRHLMLARNKNLKSRLGITEEAYSAMFRQQYGSCAICQGVNANGKRLAVDHDHATGRVRGLLCHVCNL